MLLSPKCCPVWNHYQSPTDYLLWNYNHDAKYRIIVVRYFVFCYSKIEIFNDGICYNLDVISCTPNCFYIPTTAAFISGFMFTILLRSYQYVLTKHIKKQLAILAQCIEQASCSCYSFPKPPCNDPRGTVLYLVFVSK